MKINPDGSVTADLTGVNLTLSAEHIDDEWGRQQVDLTIGTRILGGTPEAPPLADVAHLKVNAANLPALIESLQETYAEARRFYADHGERTPAFAHGGSIR